MKSRINKIHIIALTAGLFFFSGMMSQAAAQKFYIAHQSNKLFASVTLDEAVDGWSGDLPQGWKVVSSMNKPNKYYFSLGSVTPELSGGKTVFLVSRWNFVNTALQDGFTEEVVAMKLKDLRKILEIRFKEDVLMEEPREEFIQLQKADIDELIAEDRIKIDFSISAKGTVVVKTTTKKLVKLFVENYSSACYITARFITENGGISASEKILVKMLEHAWRADLDGDGLIDVQWNPISYKGSSNFEVFQDYSIALVKIHKR